MKRLLAFVIAAALAFLYVLLPDPFGARFDPGLPPRLAEAPPAPDDDPPVRSLPAAPVDRVAAGSEEPTAPTPRLSGQVTDLLGRPITGARVALHREPDEREAGTTLYDLFRRTIAPPVPLHVAVTDDAGAFELTPPPPGRYRVKTTAPDRAIDTLRDIELTEEAPGGDIEIRLAPGVELRGRVVEAGGGVVPHAAILVRAEATVAEPAVEHTAVSNAQGRYRFPALPADRTWGILVRADGWVAGGVWGARLPQTELEFVLNRGRPFRLTVVKAGLLEALHAQVLVRSGGVPVAAGETDAAGVFSFRGVPSREVTIHVQPDGYQAGLFQERLMAADGDLGRRRLAIGRPVVVGVVDADTGRGIAATDVRVDHAEHAGILPPRWLLSDRHGVVTIVGYGGRGLELAAFRDGHAPAVNPGDTVFEGWPAGDLRLLLRRLGVAKGRVFGPRGTAVADVELRAILSPSVNTGRVASRRDGSFALRDVPVGQPFRVVGWHQDFGYGVSRPLRIETASVPGRVDLRLSGANTLRGLVVDELGTRVAEARVRAETVEDAPLLVAEAVSGADGRFRLDGLAAGRLRLVAERAGHQPAVVEVSYSGGAFPEQELRAPRRRVFTGTVYHRDRLPAAGIVVRALRLDDRREAGWGRTGLDGRFRLAGTGPGEYTLEAAADDGTSAATRAVAASGHVVLVLGRVSGAPSEGR